MTEKELLYFEDAISHEDILISICEDISEKLEDEELKEFISNEVEVHNSIKKNLKDKLEEKVNE